MIRLIYFVPIWIIFLLFRTVLIALGLIITPPLAILNRYTTKTETSLINGRLILNWKYKIFWLFSNQEDGLIGASEFKDKPIWFRIIYWCAGRNPVNNLRFVPFLSVKIDPSKVNFIGSWPKTYSGELVSEAQKNRLLVYDRDEFRFISLTWQGIYSNLRIQWGMYLPNITFKYYIIPIKIVFNFYICRFWIGWKLYPHDRLGVAPNDYRYHGAGFATQLKRIYPRENK